ncbi:MAG: pilus assembly protein PilM [Rhodoferax sp.]|nr:pilus assembly protein PilM [Rhodoferax sp.]
MIALRSLFSRQPAPLIGLDVCTSGVKLVELGMDKTGHLVLERCAVGPLGHGWMNEGSIEKFDEVADAIKRLVKKIGTKTRKVAMALPASNVITKKIILPSDMSEEELEQQVQTEANQYIPFPLDEVNLDFCVIGPAPSSAPSSAGDVGVLIAASRREKVQDLQGLAEAAGLIPVVVDVKSFASRAAARRLIANLSGESKGQVVALFQIGSHTTSMQVLRDDDLLYDRDQSFGGAQLTQEIVRQYGFSAEEAELKKRTGDLPEDYVVGVLASYIDSLVQELARALQFFFTSTPHSKVDTILLAGGSAGLPGLTAAVSRYTAFPCVLLNPFEGMQIRKDVRLKNMQREAPTYLTACGLALRRFTL